jgi:hypothetical protein
MTNATWEMPKRHVALGDVIVGVTQCGRDIPNGDFAFTRLVDIHVHHIPFAGHIKYRGRP